MPGKLGHYLAQPKPSDRLPYILASLFATPCIFWRWVSTCCETPVVKVLEITAGLAYNGL